MKRIAGMHMKIMESHRIKGEIFFSPVFGSDYQQITKYILTNNIPVRFQIPGCIKFWE